MPITNANTQQRIIVAAAWAVSTEDRNDLEYLRKLMRESDYPVAGSDEWDAIEWPQQLPRMTAGAVIGELEAAKVAVELCRRSMWFMVEPQPNNVFAICVETENMKTLNRILST